MSEKAEDKSTYPEYSPEGFTLKLALVDAVPVAEFDIGMIAIASKFRSVLFAAGGTNVDIGAGSGRDLKYFTEKGGTAYISLKSGKWS